MLTKTTKFCRLPVTENTNEMEPRSRFIDLFLFGLLNDPNQAHTLYSVPDLCIARLQGVKWSTTLGFGEANMYLVCQDFLLVAIFCKNALDSQSMVRILGLQAVGRTIAFYVLALPTSGLYVMYEITKVQISDLLQNLSKLIIDISDLLLVLNVYDRPQALQRHCPTISSSILDQLFTMRQSRKRPCHLKNHHN
ncbi:hypothetical protein BCV72DRAFT_256046 [Rhizopus microsporus var. microsporus]|uniref:Uncharacterized protein n=1 Tax=Rhizopus microsporus var. microsporus TaxID=86635 RepID=A0A1X0R4U2_RHIZD|nr:hypothetical protein BCV72DRAFT_256046 [Rhizopus microsporus var. microsporus]